MVNDAKKGGGNKSREHLKATVELRKRRKMVMVDDDDDNDNRYAN